MFQNSVSHQYFMSFTTILETQLRPELLNIELQRSCSQGACWLSTVSPPCLLWQVGASSPTPQLCMLRSD